MWLVTLLGCARIGRTLLPERFAAPAAPTGELADVTTASGWRDEPPVPYRAPVEARSPDGAWVGPVSVTDRGWIEVRPLAEGAELHLWTRRDDLVPYDFRPVLARTGTLPGSAVTALRFVPGGALTEPFRLHLADLSDGYGPAPIRDGDLLLLEVAAPGRPSERYWFRARQFGVFFRPGAGVLVPVAFPWIDRGRVSASPALVGSLAFHYRPRTRNPALSFVGEQLGVVGSVGVGSTALQSVTGLDDAGAAFDSAVAGVGVEGFQLVSGSLLVNVSSAFRDVREAELSVAVGVDAVRLGWVAGRAVGRLASDHPMAEDEPR